MNALPKLITLRDNKSLQTKENKELLLEKLNSQELSFDDFDVVFSGESEHIDGICSECYAKVYSKGEIHFCRSCGTVEGTTYEVSNFENIKIMYNWDKKQWIESPENLGDEDNHL